MGLSTFEEENAVVDKYLDKFRLPFPERPEDFGETYEFPNDPDTLSDIRLGTLMLKISAYFSYSTRMLGVVESEIAILDSLLKEGIARFRMDPENKRMNVDLVEAAVAVTDAKFADLRTRKVRRTAVQLRLKAAPESHKILFGAFSRELARRGMTVKMA